MPNTYLGRRQPAFRPVISSEQPQSEPGTGCGTTIVSRIGLPSGDWNTRRAAIRRIVRGATKDLRISALTSRCQAGGLLRISEVRPHDLSPLSVERPRGSTIR